MVSIVVPIYNEEALIVQFHEAIARAMNGITEEWEVVYVNDGSTDASLELLKGLQSMDWHVVVVELSRNWGHMGAITAGLHMANGRAVILMDGDFQDPPEVLPRLIDAWRKGAEIVVAVRRSRQESRKILAALFPLFYRVLGALSDYPIPLNAGIFSLMDRKAVDALELVAGKKPLPAGNASVGWLPERDRLLRPSGPGGGGRQTIVHKPDQVRHGRDHGIQLQTYAAQLRAIWVILLRISLAGGRDAVCRERGGNCCSWRVMRRILCRRTVVPDRRCPGRVHRARL